MTPRTKRILRLVLGKPLPATQTIDYQYRAVERSFQTVRLFYALLLFHLAKSLLSVPLFMRGDGIDPLWPISWVPFIGTELSALLIFPGATLFALLVTIFPERQSFRIILVPLLIFVGAYVNSFGKINHNWHADIIIAFFLAGLPALRLGQIKGSFSQTRNYLMVVNLAIAGFMLCYSLSGFWKFSVGIAQLARGEISAFHPEALAYHVSRRLAQTAHTPNFFAAFLLKYPWVGWLPYLLTIYAELFALLAAFRLRGHRLFGFLLIAFHMGSYLVLNIAFFHHQLLLIVLLIASPLIPSNTNIVDMLQSLPVFGDLLRWRAESSTTKCSKKK